MSDTRVHVYITFYIYDISIFIQNNLRKCFKVSISQLDL